MPAWAPTEISIGSVSPKKDPHSDKIKIPHREKGLHKEKNNIECLHMEKRLLLLFLN